MLTVNVVVVVGLVVVGGVVCFVVCVVGLVWIVVLLAIWRGVRPQMATNGHKLLDQMTSIL